MVSVKIGQLFALQIGTLHLDDLRRPCFAGNFNNLDLAAPPVPPAPLTTSAKPLCSRSQVVRLQTNRADLLRSVLANHGAIH